MKILLVDDSRDTRYRLRIELKNLGIEVKTADSAETAVESLKSEIPDAILMDHIMPGLNGSEALEIIHADPRTAHIPIVLCTTREDEAFTATALQKGVLEVLPKPVAIERLPGLIERISAAIAGQVTRAAPPPPTREPASPLVATLDDPALLEQIETRVQTALDRRLTATIEHLRHDLTELLSAETQHLVEAQVAELRATQSALPPPATQSELQALERRLIDEQLPQLIAAQIATVWPTLKSEILAELARQHPPAPAGMGVAPPRPPTAQRLWQQAQDRNQLWMGMPLLRETRARVRGWLDRGAATARATWHALRQRWGQ
ncbi:MAG: response regulator [Sphingobacteriia bacterium]|nr:response regulator [Sphingobacteriia bacterium]NCC38472.1 response regulator [Gammaproteobacteria bacterium]